MVVRDVLPSPFRLIEGPARQHPPTRLDLDSKARQPQSRCLSHGEDQKMSIEGSALVSSGWL